MIHAPLIFAHPDAKKWLFRALLIFTHLLCAKINGSQKLMGLR